MLMNIWKSASSFSAVQKEQKFSGLVDEMVEIEVAATHAYQKVLKELGRPSPKIDPALEHILTTGMFHTF